MTPLYGRQNNHCSNHGIFFLNINERLSKASLLEINTLTAVTVTADLSVPTFFSFLVSADDAGDDLALEEAAPPMMIQLQSIQS